MMEINLEEVPCLDCGEVALEYQPNAKRDGKSWTILFCKVCKEEKNLFASAREAAKKAPES